MNRLYFDSHALKVYSEDIDNLQDNIQSEITKVYKQTIDYINTAAIITGFNVTHNTDVTKINVTHDNSMGSFITANGDVVVDSSNHIGLSLADYTANTINIICAMRSITLGSFDRVHDVIVDGAKTSIDFSNYSLVYDREVEKCEIIIYTQAVHNALTDKSNLCLIGKATAHGVGISPTLDLTGRVYTTQRILDGSITLSKLDPTIIIPQKNVGVTSTGIINDSYYSATGTHLYDDLNRLRTEIKDIKGLPHWSDTSSSSLTDINTDLLATHRNGVFDGAISSTNTNLAATISTSTTLYPNTSTGIQTITIDSGKYLIHGKTEEVFPGLEKSFVLSDLSTFTLDGSHGYVQESITVGSISDPVTFALSALSTWDTIDIYGYVKDSSVVVYSEDLGITFVKDRDYHILNGILTIIPGGAIYNRTIKVKYTFAQRRFDAIDFGLNNEVTFVTSHPVVPSSPATPLFYAAVPTPPPVTPGSIRLYLIERIPFNSAIIHDCRFYVQNIRDVVSITSADSDTDSFYSYNRLTHVKSNGFVDTNWSEWIIGNTNGRYWSAGSNKGSSINSVIYTKDNDDIYIRATKTTSFQKLKVEVEIDPDSNNFETTYVTLYSAIRSDDEPLPVGIKLTAGFHKIRITLEETSPVFLWGIIVGRSEMEYFNNPNSSITDTATNQFIGNSLAIGSPQSNASYSIALPTTNPWSGIGIFNHDLYLFNTQNTSYFVYNEYRANWIQYTFPVIVDQGYWVFSEEYIVVCHKDASAIYVTTDGIVWRTVTLASTISVKNVKVVNGYIYIFQDGTPTVEILRIPLIHSSTNTIESYSLPIAKIWTDIEFFNGKYVVVSNDTYVTSDSGMSTWDSPQSFTAGTWTKLLVQQNYMRLVLVGSDNNILVTSDLITWSSRSVNLSTYKNAFLVQDWFYFLQDNSNIMLKTRNFIDWGFETLAQPTTNTISYANLNSIYIATLWVDSVLVQNVLNAFSVTGNSVIDGDLHVGGAIYANGAVNPNPNIIANGSFDIWTSGKVFTNLVPYTPIADNWTFFYDGYLPNASAQQSSLTQSEVRDTQGATSACNVNLASVGSGSGNICVYTEILNLRKYQSKTLTLSFFAKGSLLLDNFHVLASAFYGAEGVISTPEVIFESGSLRLNKDIYTKHILRFTVPDFSTKTFGADFEYKSKLRLIIGYWNTLGDVPNAVRNISITSVKVEVGSMATPFIPNSFKDNIGITPNQAIAPQSLINPEFKFWLDRTASNTTDAYCGTVHATCVVGASGICTREFHPFGAVKSNGHTLTYFCRDVVTGGSLDSDVYMKQFIIPGMRSYAGKTVTIRVKIKADYPKYINMRAVQHVGSGGTGGWFDPTSAPQLITQSYADYSFTYNIPEITSAVIGPNKDDMLYFNLFYDVGANYVINTFRQSGTFDLALVTINEGSVALPYIPRTDSEELALIGTLYETNLPTGRFPSDTLTVPELTTMFTSLATNSISGSLQFKYPKLRTPRVTVVGSTYDTVANALTGEVVSASFYSMFGNDTGAWALISSGTPFVPGTNYSFCAIIDCRL